MTDLPTLKSLLKRVEKAEGPDRELDAAITVALSLTITRKDDLIYLKTVRKEDQVSPGTYWRVSRSGWSLRTSELYTSSIDAALSLVNERLPGANYRVSRTGGDWRPGYIHSAYVMTPYSGAGDHETGFPRGDGDGHTPALAILSALLRALISQAKQKEVSDA